MCKHSKLRTPRSRPRRGQDAWGPSTVLRGAQDSEDVGEQLAAQQEGEAYADGSAQRRLNDLLVADEEPGYVEASELVLWDEQEGEGDRTKALFLASKVFQISKNKTSK